MRTREIDAHDEDALRRFFEAIPPGNRAFFKEDVGDPGMLRRSMDDARGVRLVAVDDDVEVVAAHRVVIDMFLALGFTPEALLRDQLWTRGEEPGNVVLLSHLADEAGQSVVLAAPDEALA